MRFSCKWAFKSGKA